MTAWDVPNHDFRVQVSKCAVNCYYTMSFIPVGCTHGPALLGTGAPSSDVRWMLASKFQCFTWFLSTFSPSLSVHSLTNYRKRGQSVICRWKVTLRSWLNWQGTSAAERGSSSCRVQWHFRTETDVARLEKSLR